MEPNYRRCISCRTVAPKTEFLQVVREPTGNVAVNKGAGRSAYVCPNPSCLGLSQKKKRLERALRSTVPPEVYAELWRCLADHA